MTLSSVYHNIMSKSKLQDRYDYGKYFCVNNETHFLISCFQFSLAFSFGKILLSPFYLIFYLRHFYKHWLVITIKL